MRQVLATQVKPPRQALPIQAIPWRQSQSQPSTPKAIRLVAPRLANSGRTRSTSHPSAHSGHCDIPHPTNPSQRTPDLLDSSRHAHRWSPLATATSRTSCLSESAPAYSTCLALTISRPHLISPRRPAISFLAPPDPHDSARPVQPCHSTPRPASPGRLPYAVRF